MAVCHTVQVANDNLPLSNADQTKQEEENKNPSQTTGANTALSKMYSISDITEESHNSSQQSDVNAMETSLSADPNGTPIMVNTSMQVTSDINPLLNDSPKTEKRKRPQIVKRSPNFTRVNARVHPMSMPPQGLEMVNGVAVRGGEGKQVMFPSSLQSIPTGRPLSMQFKRSTSEMDLPEYGGSNGVGVVGGGGVGHRRSQSYGAPGAYITQSGKCADATKAHCDY